MGLCDAVGSSGEFLWCQCCSAHSGGRGAGCIHVGSDIFATVLVLCWSRCGETFSWNGAWTRASPMVGVTQPMRWIVKLASGRGLIHTRHIRISFLGSDLSIPISVWVRSLYWLCRIGSSSSFSRRSCSSSGERRGAGFGRRRRFRWRLPRPQGTKIRRRKLATNKHQETQMRGDGRVPLARCFRVQRGSIRLGWMWGPCVATTRLV